MKLRPFRVKVDERTTTHSVVVKARSHEEAFSEALRVLNFEGRSVSGSSEEIMMTLHHKIQQTKDGKWYGYAGRRKIRSFTNEKQANRWLSRQRDINPRPEYGPSYFAAKMSGFAAAARKVAKEERTLALFDPEGKAVN